VFVCGPAGTAVENMGSDWVGFEGLGFGVARRDAASGMARDWRLRSM
jgi:hypothetical protein